MKKNYCKNLCRIIVLTPFALFWLSNSFAQKNETVKIVPLSSQKKIDVIIGNKIFTSFLYPDTLEKPVLYPVHAANGTVVTRGFPMNPQPGDPTDHPHHLGIWFTYENVNGLDFGIILMLFQKKKNIYMDG